MNSYCTYLRVSTQKQKRTMLGIDAQRKMCLDFIKSHNGIMCQEFTDFESGTHRDRKGLQEAISYCKSNKCPLVIAKLDRLARDVEFCFRVVNTGIEIHFCDMPQINTLLLGVFATVAQYERELTSDRTKKALRALKEKGEKKLGAANEKYYETFNKRTDMEKKDVYRRRGNLKREHFQESRDFVAFTMILHRTFPEFTEGDDKSKWKWNGINCKVNNMDKMVELIKDYKSLDATLFRKFDGSEYDKTRIRTFLRSYKRSIGIIN